MNDSNNLENQLRSWIPRPPSPTIRERLFREAIPAGSAAIEVRPVNPAAWNWLAPAMAVFLFGMFLAGRDPHGWADLTGSQMASLALSQPAMATYCDASHHSDANMPPVAKFASAAPSPSTFEWTNPSGSLTTAPPMLNTNSPLP